MNSKIQQPELLNGDELEARLITLAKKARRNKIPAIIFMVLFVAWIIAAICILVAFEDIADSPMGSYAIYSSALPLIVGSIFGGIWYSAQHKLTLLAGDNIVRAILSESF